MRARAVSRTWPLACGRHLTPSETRAGGALALSPLGTPEGEREPADLRLMTGHPGLVVGGGGTHLCLRDRLGFRPLSGRGRDGEHPIKWRGAHRLCVDRGTLRAIPVMLKRRPMSTECQLSDESSLGESSEVGVTIDADSSGEFCFHWKGRRYSNEHGATARTTPRVPLPCGVAMRNAARIEPETVAAIVFPPAPPHVCPRLRVGGHRAPHGQTVSPERGDLAHVATGTIEDGAPCVPFLAAAARRVVNIHSPNSKLGREDAPSTSMGGGGRGAVAAMGRPRGQVSTGGEQDMGERGHRWKGRMVASCGQGSTRSRERRERRAASGKRSQRWDKAFRKVVLGHGPEAPLGRKPRWIASSGSAWNWPLCKGWPA